MSEKFDLSEEQKNVLKSSGKVHLSAGAGGGKTFVIIEKVIKVIKEKLSQKELNQIEIKKDINFLCEWMNCY